MSDSVASQIGLCIPLGTVHIYLPGGTEQGLLERFKSSMSAALITLISLRTDHVGSPFPPVLPQRPAHTFWRALPGSYSAGVRHLQVLKKEFKSLLLRKCTKAEDNKPLCKSVVSILCFQPKWRSSSSQGIELFKESSYLFR